MEASPKLSTILQTGGDHGRLEGLLEPYTHYLDRISCKEGYRAGVYWTSGDYYCGEWHENKRHGKGMHTYQNGNRYEGEWKNGKKEGHGTYWIKSGKYYIRKYKGKWKENQYGGSGTYFGLGGELYVGDWERGKRQGIGKQTYRDWSHKGEAKYHIYYGRWANGKREGQGHLAMSNGNVFQGDFKNDWKEGVGVFYFKDKQSKYEGLWRNDIAVYGLYSRNTKPGQQELPFVMVPSCEGLSKKCLKLAASQPPPQHYNRAERRTDPSLNTRKFYNVLHGSPLLD